MFIFDISEPFILWLSGAVDSRVPYDYAEQTLVLVMASLLDNPTTPLTNTSKGMRMRKLAIILHESMPHSFTLGKRLCMEGLLNESQEMQIYSGKMKMIVISFWFVTDHVMPVKVRYTQSRALGLNAGLLRPSPRPTPPDNSLRGRIAGINNNQLSNSGKIPLLSIIQSAALSRSSLLSSTWTVNYQPEWQNQTMPHSRRITRREPLQCWTRPGMIPSLLPNCQNAMVPLSPSATLCLRTGSKNHIIKQSNHKTCCVHPRSDKM